MQDVDLIYYLAGGFLFAMARAETLTGMRLWYISASLLFVAYGLLAQVWPVAVLNGAVAATQIARMVRRAPVGG